MKDYKRPVRDGGSRKPRLYDNTALAGVYRLEAGHYEVATGHGIARIVREAGSWKVWLPAAKLPARREKTLAGALEWLGWLIHGEGHTLAQWREARAAGYARAGHPASSVSRGRSAIVRMARAQAQAERRRAWLEAPSACEAALAASRAADTQARLYIYAEALEAEREAAAPATEARPWPEHTAAYDFAYRLREALPAFTYHVYTFERPALMRYFAAMARMEAAEASAQPIAPGKRITPEESARLEALSIEYGQLRTEPPATGKDGQPCAAGR